MVTLDEITKNYNSLNKDIENFAFNILKNTSEENPLRINYSYTQSVLEFNITKIYKKDNQIVIKYDDSEEDEETYFDLLDTALQINILHEVEDICNEIEILKTKIDFACTKWNATKENPIKSTESTTMLVIGDDEAMGLSELEKPEVETIYKEEDILWDEENTLWVTIKGKLEPTKVNSLTKSDLENIVNWLIEEKFY